MSNIDEILQNSEKIIKIADKFSAKAHNTWREAERDNSGENVKLWHTTQCYYFSAIHEGLRALYEQNKAIIELLKGYKK